MRRTVLVLAIVGAALLAGCAGEEANVVTEETWEVPNGQFIEVDFETDEGTSVSIQATAPQEFFWDIHYHDEAGAIQIVEEGTTSSLSYDLEGQVDGLHSLLLQNEGEETYEVDVLIEGDAEFVNFRRGNT